MRRTNDNSQQDINPRYKAVACLQSTGTGVPDNKLIPEDLNSEE